MTDSNKNATRKLAPWHYPDFIAHRGAGKLAPENTLAAFRRGHAAGYRMFECDVKLSADGVAYLMHDATLQRTTDGLGDAAGEDWKTLSQLDAGNWHSAEYAGETLPTLAAVASFCMANACHLNIEIKPIPGTEAHTGRVVANLAAELWAGSAVPPLLSSFSEEALAAAHAAQFMLPTALLVNLVPDDWQEKLHALGCIALDVNCLFLTDDHIREIKSAGYRLLTYTCNEADEARRLLALGVDSVITDAMVGML